MQTVPPRPVVILGCALLVAYGSSPTRAAPVLAPQVAQSRAGTELPSSEAAAQEPSKGAGGEPTAVGTVAAPDPAADPTAVSEEPAPPEETASEGMPPAREPAPPETTISNNAPSEPSTQYGLGVHLRGIFVPEWLLGLFLDASTPLNSAAFGAEFVRRKGNFDIVASVDFGFYSPRDGNYLGKGDDPTVETDYVHFDGLSTLAFAVHFIRHEGILDWLSFVWGGGVGLAVVLGDIFRASSNNCTAENLDDLSLEGCRPAFPDYSPDSDAWKKNGENFGSQAEDTPANPKIFEEDDVPPVLPLVHLLVGFNFKITDDFGVRVDGGFRNAFYVGATGHYFF